MATSSFHFQVRALLRIGWPILLLLGFLWFPFDWLSTAWPAFGDVFRVVFRNAHDHLIGHTVFFLLVGSCILAYVPALRRKLHWYLIGLLLAALVQEAIQALAMGRLPTFTDTNAFTGDALGGMSAFIISWCLLRLQKARRRYLDQHPDTP